VGKRKREVFVNGGRRKNCMKKRVVPVC